MENHGESSPKEIRKEEVIKKVMALVAEGKNAFENVTETLGVTDATEQAIINELAACEHRSVTMSLFNGKIEEIRENDAARRPLERVLQKIGKAGYIEDVKTIGSVDYSTQMARRREDESRRQGK